MLLKEHKYLAECQESALRTTGTLEEGAVNSRNKVDLYPKSWERMTGNIEKQEIPPATCLLLKLLSRNSCSLQLQIKVGVKQEEVSQPLSFKISSGCQIFILIFCWGIRIRYSDSEDHGKLQPFVWDTLRTSDVSEDFELPPATCPCPQLVFCLLLVLWRKLWFFFLPRGIRCG